MSQNWYKRTEAYLYNYKEWRGRLKVLHVEFAVAMATLYPSGVANYSETLDKLTRLGSSTEAAAIARVMGDIRKVPGGKAMMDELLDLQLKVTTVESGLASLTSRERELVELHYLEGFRHNETADRLGMARTTYHEFKQEVVAKLARCMGFLDTAAS